MSGREPEARIQRPVIRQSWRRVAFLHWETDPDAVARVLPDDLEPDLVDGRAWVAITAFEVQRFRFMGLPAIPRVSHFAETNVRTYVRHRNGDDGLWFLSLEVASRVNVVGGRLIGAPYFCSVLSIDGEETIRYRCRRA